MEDFAIIDFETTGLNPEADRIIEVAAGIGDKYLVQQMNPGRALPGVVSNLTGLTDDMLAGQPSPEIVMPVLRDFLGDRVLVAHNAEFDMGFLRAEMARAGLGCNWNCICTLKLSRKLFPEIRHSLTAMAKYFEIDMEYMQAHRALSDVMLTSVLWKRLRDVIKERYGKEADLETCLALMAEVK